MGRSVLPNQHAVAWGCPNAAHGDNQTSSMTYLTFMGNQALKTRKTNCLRVALRIMARVDAFLRLGLAQGCSDLHLAVGVPPMLRMHGDLMPIKFRELGQAELEAYITEVLTQSQQKHLREGNDLDFSYVSIEGGRFRVNVFRKETGIGAAFRSIPTQMPSIEQLGLPPIVKKLCDNHQGMILVTG